MLDLLCCLFELSYVVITKGTYMISVSYSQEALTIRNNANFTYKC